MKPNPPELVYDGECPYCRAIARWVRTMDLRNRFRLTDINSGRGRLLVESHHSRFVDTPHLFTDELVYYGVKPTARGVFKELPRAAVR